MSVIKCKMCGGDLELIEGSSVAVCEYCGSQQTVPAADNEKKLTLFARANRLRLACEFDKAAGVYESIVADFPTEAEAYWGLVLCRYGIEYVDDPATGKKIPTCHRSSFDSVMEDSDFEQALENADAVARRVYRDEAKAIEELRRGIVEVSSKEPPYDIFICYKETAEDGQRTVDSVIAQDVYDALTEKGYRVFFSRISLEDKLGTEYEPYIFAALHSAKIMLAFGTDYEFYNAVWVKNEWSRYLQLMTKDKSKHLIPCYKGIDAYDMPKEFAKLQAQDMGKVGAMQDLLRGVDKIMGKGAGAAPAADTTAAPAPTVNPTVTSLLERAEMFLADGDWDNADTYCERTLDIEPKNGTAYLYKLMADLDVSKKEDLENCTDSFDTSNNYQKAIRFGDEALRNTLEGYITHIKQRKEDEENRKREARLNGIYTAAQQRMSTAKFEADYKDAAEMFATVPNYRDADKLHTVCLERAKDVVRFERPYAAAQHYMMVAKNEADYREAAELFAKLPQYRDANELLQQCLKAAENYHKNAIYSEAVSIAVRKSPNTLREAANRLAGIPGWRDADELHTAYLQQADRLEVEESAAKSRDAKNAIYEKAVQLAAFGESNYQRKAAEEFALIPGWRDADEKAELCRQAAERLARQEEERAEQEHRQQQWRIAGRCQHCGGEFKGLFTKKCVQCHREKDY